ncbi:MAG: glycosyltransferase, partial [bacterium]
MRIVHYLTSLSIGGAENLICLLCSENAKDNKNQFHIIILNDVFDKMLLSELKQTGVEVILFRRNIGRSWNLPFYLFKSIKQLFTIKPDIIHAHNKLSCLMGIACSFFLRSKTVYTIHNTNLFRNTLSDNAYRLLFMYIVDKIIAISKAVKNDFYAHQKRHIDKCEIVQNGIKISNFKNIRKRSILPKIICVGRLDHVQKGQDLLIQALWTIYCEYSLLFQCQIVGDGKSRKLLERMIREYNIGDQVMLLGNRRDIPFLLNQADIFVLPSRYEGLGIVILEAMASGLAIISSDIEGPSEIIHNGKKINDDTVIASIFNNYFANIGPSLAKTIPQASDNFTHFLPSNNS